MSTRRDSGTATRAERTLSVIDGFTGEHRFLSNFWVHQPGKTTGGTANIIRKARAAGKPMIRVNPTDRTVTSVTP